MNWTGIIFGVFAALMIGTGFMWVIRFEYYVGAYYWKLLCGAGIALVALSAFMPNFVLSAVVGIIGGCIAWGAVELPHQQERVDHGLFRAHPNRANHKRLDTSEHSHGHGNKPGLGKWWSF